MKALALACALSVAAPAAAEDAAFRASMVAAVAAHGADLGSTTFCLGAGRCREMNPFLLRFEQPATFGAVKMGTAGLQLWLVAKMHDRWPKAAIAVNLATAGAFSLIAARNARVSR